MLQATLEELDQDKLGHVKLQTFTRLMQLCGLPFMEDHLRERVLNRFTNPQTHLLDYQKAIMAFKLIYRMREGVVARNQIKTKREQLIEKNPLISVSD